mmetsp:Transcript_422/g.1223  ORF Transcript_422/g.1223 Transcript_422/m.1223 type:complete len:289 (+) Transcript_422:937-1803(+)
MWPRSSSRSSFSTTRASSIATSSQKTSSLTPTATSASLTLASPSPSTSSVMTTRCAATPSVARPSILARRSSLAPPRARTTAPGPTARLSTGGRSVCSPTRCSTASRPFSTASARPCSTKSSSATCSSPSLRPSSAPSRSRQMTLFRRSSSSKRQTASALATRAPPTSRLTRSSSLSTGTRSATHELFQIGPRNSPRMPTPPTLMLPSPKSSFARTTAPSALTTLSSLALTTSQKGSKRLSGTSHRRSPPPDLGRQPRPRRRRLPLATTMTTRPCRLCLRLRPRHDWT